MAVCQAGTVILSAAMNPLVAHSGVFAALRMTVPNLIGNVHQKDRRSPNTQQRAAQGPHSTVRHQLAERQGAAQAPPPPVIPSLDPKAGEQAGSVEGITFGVDECMGLIVFKWRGTVTGTHSETQPSLLQYPQI